MGVVASVWTLCVGVLTDFCADFNKNRGAGIRRGHHQAIFDLSYFRIVSPIFSGVIFRGIPGVVFGVVFRGIPRIVSRIIFGVVSYFAGNGQAIGCGRVPSFIHLTGVHAAFSHSGGKRIRACHYHRSYPVWPIRIFS